MQIMNLIGLLKSEEFNGDESIVGFTHKDDKITVVSIITLPGESITKTREFTFPSLDLPESEAKPNVSIKA